MPTRALHTLSNAKMRQPLSALEILEFIMSSYVVLSCWQPSAALLQLHAGLIAVNGILQCSRSA
jgi:hypothetical protein